MQHLTRADYRRMPWANGRGVTVEMWREDAGGQLSLRLSMATVTDDGPFSLFPGIDRILTVISGPGFDLVGEGMRLRADPLRPVTFPGEVALNATGVTGVSEDFNVMVARRGLAARIEVLGPGDRLEAKRMFVFSLGPTEVEAEGQNVQLSAHDLLVATDQVTLTRGGPALAVGVTG
jgi:hypothetical protein